MISIEQTTLDNEEKILVTVIGSVPVYTPLGLVNMIKYVLLVFLFALSTICNQCGRRSLALLAQPSHKKPTRRVWDVLKVQKSQNGAWI